MDDKEIIAQEVMRALGISPLIKNIVIERCASPWNEKTLIKTKKDHLAVKLFVWDDPTFLYGRMHRLFLYVFDVLNPAFYYRPRMSPDEEKEPQRRNRFSQIWSIYVDSRMERQGIDNFYDKRLRENLFIDTEKELPWESARAVFRALWRKDLYTYPEIIDYSYDLSTLRGIETLTKPAAPETDLVNFLQESSVKKHMDRISSPALKEMAHDILNFAAYHCKDTFIEARYYGISMAYHRRTFLEIIPTSNKGFFLTMLDSQLNVYETETVTEGSDMHCIQKMIKERYDRMAFQSHHG
ncbi:hypothetical protein [Syntrophorhabdus aromaticivorans]|uniref:hypothetical protein n=1 Tax=Syntrophorhabdus aromaticivorans TaxID=328301 RepID=UPI00042090DC|nr:hypothetical protein [Syntrophorhabdus aromaticivorans]